MRRTAALLLSGFLCGSVAACGWIRVEGSPTGPPGVQDAAAASVSPRGAAGGSVVVQRGDTLYSIARRTRVPLRGLIAANDLKPPYRILPGDRLVLPPPPQIHVVQPGDTVYGISRRYGADVTSVVKANDISPPYTIVAGEALVIPEGNLETLVAGDTAATEAPASSREVEVQALPPPDRQPAQAGADTPGSGEADAGRPEVSPAQEKPPASVAAIPAPDRPSRGVRFIRPLEGRVLSSYGPKAGGLHNDGINIAAPRGTAVRAAEDGVVAYAGSELPGFGQLVLLKHAEGWTTAYGHNEALLVKRGDRVARGQTIARVGSTGNVSNPQLHFEIRRGARAIDPMPYFRKSTSVSGLPAEYQPVPLNLIALQPSEKTEAEQRLLQ